MPLPLSADTLDALPEAARSFYIPKDGKFVLDAPIEDVTGLKAAQRAALDEKKKLDDKIKATLGDRSLDDVAELIRKQKELDEQALSKDKLLDKRLSERDAEWQKKYDAVAAYKQKYEDRELEAAIRKAAIPAGVDPKDLEEYVIPLVKHRRVKLDGEKVVVLDKDGDPTGLSVEKFFTETYRQEAPKFYQAAGGSGGGATNGNGSGSRTASKGNVANDMNDLIGRITSDPDALKQASMGKLTVRSA